MVIDKKTLALLVCPECKVSVELSDGATVCTKCRRRFPIRDDIPIMLLGEATEPQEEKSDRRDD